jgi:hypothetical protein
MTVRSVAVALWLAAAVVVWNLVFDRVLIDAGREYVRTAADAAHGPGPYARIDDSMRPAVPRALVLATSAAGVILVVGFAAFRWSARATSREPLRKT